jgi:hypothetical protein
MSPVASGPFRKMTAPPSGRKCSTLLSVSGASSRALVTTPLTLKK